MTKMCLCIAAHVFSICLAFGQDSCYGRQPDQRYLDEIILFFHQTGSKEFRTDSIDLKEHVDMSEFMFLQKDENFVIDMLTPEETQQLRELVKKPPLQCWNRSLIPRASLLLTSAQTDGNTMQSPRHCYYSLSVPLFFRDFTLCVFANGFHCGPGGRGHLSVYKKVDGNWVQSHLITGWVN